MSFDKIRDDILDRLRIQGIIEEKVENDNKKKAIFIAVCVFFGIVIVGILAYILYRMEEERYLSEYEYDLLDDEFDDFDEEFLEENSTDL